MIKFYTPLRLFQILGMSLFILSCNENTVDPELYGSVKGIVKTSEAGVPLEGVTITTSPGTSSVSTNEEGAFDIGEVLVGDYTVSAKKENYTTESISISVREGQDVVLDVIMQIAPPDSKAPDEPLYVSPADKTQNLATIIDLTWNNGETETGDTLRYDVVIYEGSDDFDGTVVASNILDTTFTLTGLKFETAYEWKIVARNKSLDETEGRLWKFSTEEFPLNGYLFVKDTLGSRDIYSWDLQENHLVRLTSDGGDELYPRIMPGNHSRIAYSAMDDGVFHIFTMNLKGEDVFKVTNDRPVFGNHNDGGGFVWSPTGDQILYGYYNELIIINRDGTGWTKIANAPVNREFTQMDWTYQFDNKSEERIVALAQGNLPYENEIYLIDPDDSSMTLLVDNLEGTLSNPQFSFGGDKVIFSLDSLYEDDRGIQRDARIYSINVDGTGWTDLSGDNKTGNDLQARFSETGEKIIFMNVSNSGTEAKTIWTMDADGENREQLIYNGEMPDWYNP